MIKPYTADYLRSFLSYDRETGTFVWLRDKARAKAGQVAGSFSAATGYIQIGLNGHNIGVQRLAVLYMTGEWPTAFVDHIDGDRTNNRWGNLRVVSNAVNCQNRKRAQKDNELGVLGVTRSGKRFAATIKNDGKKIWIGTFDTPGQAHDAYLAKKREIHSGNTL